MNKENPLLFLFEGPIPTEDLTYENIVDDVGNWLDDPTLSTWFMLEGLAKQADRDKTIIPDWWKGSHEDFLADFNRRIDSARKDFASNFRGDRENLVYKSAIELGSQIPEGEEDINVFIDAGLNRLWQLSQFEILLEMWREQIRGE